MSNEIPRPQLRGQATDYVPPALYASRQEDRPYTLCASCPDALWFRRTQWNCFCDAMKNLSHQEGLSPVTVCDGRERALERLKTQAARS